MIFDKLNSAFLFAHDAGAKSILSPIANKYDAVVHELASSCASEISCHVIIGTSTSEKGSNQDILICSSVRDSGFGVIAIEDYAGNASSLVRRGLVDYLIVESEYSKRHYVSLGFPGEKIGVVQSVRYDKYRVVKPSRFRFQGLNRGLLWIGQPENGIAMAGLGWLAPWCKQHGFTVYFRAHPRDQGYHNGIFKEWFEKRRLRWVDCTTWSLEDLWESPICFAVSAFSSLAIDASFHGIPSINISHIRGVRQLLYAQKAGIRPSMAALGAAAETYGPFSSQILDRCLTASKIRNMNMSFNHSYWGQGPVIDDLIMTLKAIIKSLNNTYSL